MVPKEPNGIAAVNPVYPMQIRLLAKLVASNTKVNAGSIKAAAETLVVTTAAAATTLRSANSK